MTGFFHQLIEDDVLAGEFHVMIRIGPDGNIGKNMFQIGRSGFVECLKHQIVADIVPVKMGLDQLIDCRSHQFLECAARNPLLIRREIVKSLIDFPFQIKTVPVFEKNLLGEGFLKRRNIADIGHAPSPLIVLIPHHHRFPIVQIALVFESVQTFQFFESKIFQQPPPHLGSSLADDEVEGSGRDNFHVIEKRDRFACNGPVQNQTDMIVAHQGPVDKKIRRFSVMNDMKRLFQLLPGSALPASGGEGSCFVIQLNSISTAVSSQLSFFLHITQSLQIFPGNMDLSTTRKPSLVKK